MLNISVIGCGGWGRNHVRVLSDMADARIASVVDINEASARYVSQRYHVRCFTDPGAIFKDPAVDAVTICTPTVTHAALTLQAIEAGKHVLVEKPMADKVEEAVALIRAAERRGVHLAVGFIERFNPAVREAMNMVDAGAIGEVILAHTKRVSRWPIRVGDVGVVKDLAIHDIDIVNRLFGGEPRTIFSNAGSIHHSFEDYANIVMCFPGNRSAFIETNWLTSRKIRNLTITGTEGIIKVEYISQTVSVENANRVYQPFIEAAEPLRLELESFTRSIADDVPPEVSGLDGLKALKVCEAAIESARLGRPWVNGTDPRNELELLEEP